MSATQGLVAPPHQPPSADELAEFHLSAQSVASSLFHNQSSITALDRILNLPSTSLDATGGRRTIVAAAYTQCDHAGHIRILLGRRAPGYVYEGNWELFGGKIEPSDNTILAGLERELREEIGLKLLSVKGPICDITTEVHDDHVRITQPIRCWVQIEGVESGRLELNKEHKEYGMFTKEDVDQLQMSNGMRVSVYTALYMAENEIKSKEKAQFGTFGAES